MKRTSVVVAGHICLDIHPEFPTRQPINPGGLVEIGPAAFATGGAVANTGIALHKLGAQVQLIANVGDDVFGRELKSILTREGAKLARGVRAKPSAVTSYSIVISPPGVDRAFLHCSGENDNFDVSELSRVAWTNVGFFHFGYPPMMRSMYQHNGRNLVKVMKAARAKSGITSLDMCTPDQKTESGKANWKAICENVLPHVDFFCPSVEELVYMFDRRRFREWLEKGVDIARDVNSELLGRLSDQCLQMGAGAVMIKLGDQGLYLRTSKKTRFAEIASGWKERELHCRCRKVEVLGTTGAGDCTIAGFIYALTHQKSPEQALMWATATGAASCESADATGAIHAWPVIQKRIDGRWPWCKSVVPLDGHPIDALTAGPNDIACLRS